MMKQWQRILAVMLIGVLCVAENGYAVSQCATLSAPVVETFARQAKREAAAFAGLSLSFGARFNEEQRVIGREVFHLPLKTATAEGVVLLPFMRAEMVTERIVVKGGRIDHRRSEASAQAVAQLRAALSFERASVKTFRELEPRLSGDMEVRFVRNAGVAVQVVFYEGVRIIYIDDVFARPQMSPKTLWWLLRFACAIDDDDDGIFEHETDALEKSMHDAFVLESYGALSFIDECFSFILANRYCPPADALRWAQFIRLTEEAFNLPLHCFREGSEPYREYREEVLPLFNGVFMEQYLRRYATNGCLSTVWFLALALSVFVHWYVPQGSVLATISGIAVGFCLGLYIRATRGVLRVLFVVVATSLVFFHGGHRDPATAEKTNDTVQQPPVTDSIVVDTARSSVRPDTLYGQFTHEIANADVDGVDVNEAVSRRKIDTSGGNVRASSVMYRAA